MRWRGVVVLVLLCIAAIDVAARVGGGESYGGGGGGGGGDGDGIGLELLFHLIRFLIWLTIEYPAVGIPADILFIFCVVMWFRKKRDIPSLNLSTARAAAPAARVDELRKFDPNFSEITFSDFCYSLYARAHIARGAGDLDRYAPYLSAGARNSLRRMSPRGLTEVRAVIVGAMRVLSFGGLDTPTISATIEYEGNYTEVVGTAQASWYVKERWVLERRRDILSPPPEKAKADHCPRCGAALSTRTDGTCEYCGVKIENGAFQWYVRQISLLTREARGPVLTSNVPEQGTERPTVRRHVHVDFDAKAFQARVQQIAIELQNAWTARDWERVRPLETEPLFQMHRYWIDAYRKQDLRNIVDDFRVTAVEIVKTTTDAFFEAVTVRIWAVGRDYTVDANGRVVAGSKTDLRRWTEYWTFIRSRSGHGESNVSCPNCGAKLAAGATGICEFCGGKLTAGAFDWVLSRIEQDDAYV